MKLRSIKYFLSEITMLIIYDHKQYRVVNDGDDWHVYTSMRGWNSETRQNGTFSSLVRGETEQLIIEFAKEQIKKHEAL